MAVLVGTQLVLNHSFVALRTDAVAELGPRAGGQVLLHLLPVILIIADALAVAANGQESLQLMHAMEGLFQVADALGQALLQGQHAQADIDASPQFVAVKGLGDVIIRPAVQASDDVRPRRPRRRAG